MDDHHYYGLIISVDRWLGNNSFTGPIPSEVATMISLRELTIWGNNFNSMLPPELGNLGNLTYFNCEKCNLWGPLPAEIGKLVHLQRLYLNSNAFTGPIPQEWKALTSIYVFDLEANYLYSTVEPWLLGLNNLSHLFISDNQLYGQLPSINNTNTKATEVGLDCNYFTGNKPLLGPTLAWDSKIYGNCFSNSTDQTGTDTYCTAGVLNCQAFQRYVAANECPPCPPNQYLINSTLCICYQVQSSTSKKFPAGAVVGICIAAVVVLLAMAIFLFLWMRRKQQQFYKPDHDYFNSHDVQTWEAPKGVKRFNLQDLAKATNGFDKEHEIGSGGFGKVFIGTFPDGRTLAIKRGSGFAYTPESQSEFKNEVLLLSRLHHKNLVRLEGFCDESHLQILVYEYMKNGNLHGHLFTRKGAKYLNWYKRLEISVQIARGLDYLHSFADPPVIHRDVKPSNILLDEKLVAKVSDFGISRETPEFFSHVSTRLAGTAGYIDPQYFMKRQLTPASDVYSYGVVLLELITGQRAINGNSQGDELNNLVQWATPRLQEGGIETIIDAQLEGNYPRDIYQDMAELAIMCAAYEKEFRPSMKVILAILEPHLESAQRPVSVNDPWSLVGSTTPDTEIPNNPHDSPVSNEMSLTVTEPR
ncbi:hypothetical protein CY35_09G038400 [Sphagnum magellanicum]|nr:hypothetical protein CY35_09G038400 [Sphagnum magellanicum]